MTIAIGCDEAALEFRDIIKKQLIDQGHQVEDFGAYDSTPILYPDIGVAVAQAVAAGQCARGILICGTGIGMCITANKVPGIRAAVCHDMFSTERSRKSNNAQIMCMGARVIAPQLGEMLVDLWLKCDFEGGGSAPKVAKIMEYEAQFLMKEKL
ncbi:MAG: ribose 5-phosphate isomerase B [Oscillospiraceae bacterium]|nr:ribose 5-phosphate isomerase B [Oscillospiraceae bacterium]